MITNNEIVRVRYLIVYGSEKKSKNENKTKVVTENTLVKWICRHKWTTILVLYAAFLLLIGASNSRQGYYMREYMRKVTLNAIDYIKSFGFNYFQKLFG